MQPVPSKRRPSGRISYGRGAYSSAFLIQYAVHSTGGSIRALVQISVYAEPLEKISVARYSTFCIKTTQICFESSQ